MADTAPTPHARRYRAFISYARADRALARRLHRRLEGYALPAALRAIGQPAGRHALKPVFLDEEELVPGDDLPGRLVDSLLASEFLVVICSPASRASRWVNREVDTFVAHGRREQIVAVVVAGEPHAAARGLDPALECLPEALAAPGGRGLEAEPLWVDWRAARRGDRLPFLRIVAALLSLGSLDELVQRDRRRRRWRIAAAAVLAVSAIALASAAATAGIASARNRARTFAAASEAAYEAGRFQRALAYAVLALPPPGAVFDTSSREIHVQAAKAAAANHRLFGMTLPAGQVDVVVSPDLTRAWLSIDHKRVALVDPRDGRTIAAFPWTYYSTAPPAAFSADSRRLLTQGAGGLVVLDTRDGRVVRTLPARANVHALATAPVGRMMAGHTSDGIVLWDTSTFDEVGRFALTLPELPAAAAGLFRFGQADSLTFSSDGRYLRASFYADGQGVWEVPSGRRVSALPLRSVISEDGKFGLVHAAKRAAVVDLRHNRMIAVRSTAEADLMTSVPAAAFSTTRGRVVLPDTASSAIVVDLSDGREVGRLEGLPDVPRWCAFSADGRLIFTLAGGELSIWDAESLRRVQVFTVAAAAASRVDYDAHRPTVSLSADGSTIVTTTSRTVAAWSARLEASQLLGPRMADATAVGWSRDGRRVAVWAEGRLRLFDRVSGALLQELTGTPARGTVVLSADGSHAAIAQPNRVVHVWDLRAGGPSPHVRDGLYRDAGLSAIEFAPAGDLAALGLGDGTVRLVDLGTGREAVVLRGHTNEVRSVAFSADAAALVSASADRTVRVWSLPDGRERASFSGAFDVLSARLSPDGTRVVTASSDRFLRVWTIEGAALEREFAPPQLNLFDTFPISAAFFSTDGGRVFGRYGPIVDRRDGVSRALSGVEAVSPDGRLALDAQLQVVDVDTGIPIVRLPHSGKGVRQAAFSEDGGSILALLQDGTVQTWAAPIVADGRTLHARLCRDALAAGLRLSAEDRADPLVRMVIGPADERPCERRGLFAALAR